MTNEGSRGRKITLGIALFLAIPPMLVLLALLLTGAALARIPWLQVALPVVMAFLLFKGYTWARAYIAFSSCAGALLLRSGSTPKRESGGRSDLVAEPFEGAINRPLTMKTRLRRKLRGLSNRGKIPRALGAGEAPHVATCRLLQLRSAHSSGFRRTCPQLDLSLPGLSAPNWQCLWAASQVSSRACLGLGCLV
jgi:hypothetical protein